VVVEVGAVVVVVLVVVEEVVVRICVTHPEVVQV
jgi:hypothetical protein